MDGRFCFVACSYLKREIEAVLDTDKPVEIISFPSQADGPGDSWQSISSLFAEADELLHCHSELLGGCCTAANKNPPDILSGMDIHRREQCFEYFLSKSLLNHYYSEGAHLLLPAMAADWKCYLERNGLDRETAKAYFHETTRKLILLDTNSDPKAPLYLKEFAEYLDLPYSILPVGQDMFRLFIEQRILQWQLAQQLDTKNSELNFAEQQMADLSMAFDLINTLSASKSEAQIVKRMGNLFTMLFSPSKLLLITRDNGKVNGRYSWPEELIEEKEHFDHLAALDSEYEKLPGGSGFLINLYYGDQSLGVIEINGIAFPEHLDRYLNISLTLAKVCSLGLANARSYERLAETSDNLALALKAEQSARDALKCQQENLEELVSERTADLRKTNELLAHEMTERTLLSQRVKSILNSAGEGIFGIDQQGSVTLINPAATSMLGYSVKEMVGSDEHTLIHHTRMDGFSYPFEESPIYKTTKDGKVRHITDEVFWRKDGSRFPVEYISSPLSKHKRLAGAVVSFRDVTEQRALQKSLHQANADLAEYATIASHQLQEPLRLISNYMQLLASRYRGRLDKDADEFIDFAVGGALHMQHLLDSLLLYSHLGSLPLTMSHIDCSTLLISILESLGGEIADAGAEISHDPLPVLYANREHMQLLLEHLLDNAIKNRADRPLKVHIGIQQHGAQWLFSVADNGIGIAERHMGKIFGLFAQLQRHSAYAGVGLGLALCKKILEIYDGKIWLESNEGLGSTFYFTMPMSGEKK